MLTRDARAPNRFNSSVKVRNIETVRCVDADGLELSALLSRPSSLPRSRLTLHSCARATTLAISGAPARVQGLAPELSRATERGVVMEASAGQWPAGPSPPACVARPKLSRERELRLRLGPGGGLRPRNHLRCIARARVGLMEDVRMWARLEGRAVLPHCPVQRSVSHAALPCNGPPTSILTARSLAPPRLSFALHAAMPKVDDKLKEDLFDETQDQATDGVPNSGIMNFGVGGGKGIM